MSSTQNLSWARRQNPAGGSRGLVVEGLDVGDPGVVVHGRVQAGVPAAAAAAPAAAGSGASAAVGPPAAPGRDSRGFLVAEAHQLPHSSQSSASRVNSARSAGSSAGATNEGACAAPTGPAAARRPSTSSGGRVGSSRPFHVMHPPLVVDSGPTARPVKTEANNHDIAYLTCSPRVPVRDRRPAPRRKMDFYHLNRAFAVISPLSEMGRTARSGATKPNEGNLPRAANPRSGPRPGPGSRNKGRGPRR